MKKSLTKAGIGAILLLFSFIALSLLPQPSESGDIKPIDNLQDIKYTYNLNDKIKQDYVLDNFSFIKEVKTEYAINIEVGNKSSVDFKPQLTFKKWDNRVNLTLKYNHSDLKDISSLSLNDSKIIWKGTETEVNFYEVPTKDAYEFEIILFKKPKTDKIVFNIETNGLDFFYQPPLNMTNKTCTETDCGNDHMPEKAVGSYAVYASENIKNSIGIDDYKTGKVGHIFRPKIIDSDGNSVWGNLSIDKEKGTLIVEIPQEFLDKAIYPVKHAAGLTFGYTTAGGSYTSVSVFSMFCSIYSTSTAGTINNMSGYFYPYTSTSNMKFGLYDSSLNLLNNISTTFGAATAKWYTKSITQNVSGNLNYSLCFLTSSVQGEWYYYDATGYTNQTWTQAIANFPITATKGTSYDRKYSIYANYTVTSDTTPPTYSSNSTNSTAAGSTIKHSLLAADETALSGYIFSFDNGTGTFINDTWAAFGATGWANVSKGVNVTVGSTIRWFVWANDTTNNKNQSQIYSYVTTSATSCDCPTINTNWVVNMADYCVLTTTCNLGSGNLSYTGTGNFTINASLTVAKAKQPTSGQIRYFGSAARLWRTG